MEQPCYGMFGIQDLVLPVLELLEFWIIWNLEYLEKQEFWKMRNFRNMWGLRNLWKLVIFLELGTEIYLPAWEELKLLDYME